MSNATDERLLLLPTDMLVPWPDLNPREDFDHEEMDELVESVRACGVLQPVLVHPAVGEYWIVAGERRWRAAQRAGMPVPCLVREFTLSEAIEAALQENLHRANLNPIEEAKVLRRWLDMHPECSQRELGEKIGKSQPWIANRLRLLRLEPAQLQEVATGRVDPSFARDRLVPPKATGGWPRGRLRAPNAPPPDTTGRVGRGGARVADFEDFRGVRLVQLDDGGWLLEARVRVPSHQAGSKLSRAILDATEVSRG